MLDSFWVYSGIPYMKGRHAARRDLLLGKLSLKTFGKPARWRHAYAELLLARYGIQLDAVSDGTVNVKLREEIRGYNSVAKAEIEKRHGRDFLDALVEEAKGIALKATKQ